MKKSNFLYIVVIVLTFNFQLSTLNSIAQYSKLLDFAGNINGKFPQGSLISDGNFLYGMTQQGGANNKGTVFKIKSDGTGYMKLLDFSGTSNGSFPAGSLVSDGTFLYGMTANGGTGACSNGCGLIFKIKPDGTGYVKLFDFSGIADGSNPYGSLISDGIFLYEMTYTGGINDSGTVFKILPDGTGYSKLHNFAGGTDGMNPYASLTSDGTFLYGMTENGGTSGLGVIFKILYDGTGYVKLLDFTGVSNGSNPYGSLNYDGAFLYGTTVSGGTNNMGTIFKIMPNGTGYSKLVDFAGNSNGSFPDGSLVSDGTFLYGLAQNGGTGNCISGCGVVFKIKPDGTGYSNLLNFNGTANGRNPHNSLIFDGSLLFGMTYQGGTHDYGTVFKYCITPITFSQAPAVCAKNNFTVGIHTYTASGNYLDTLTSHQGCDSIITTNLFIDSVDTSVSVATGTLTANSSPATYQWVDCNNGYALIAGQTSQSFTATLNGNYAVIITDNLCSDTSSCYTISTTGTYENSVTEKIIISPNPFDLETTITFDKEQKNSIIIIIDILGKEIKTVNFIGKKLIIEKGEMQTGIYFLQVQTELGMRSQKLVIQK